MIRLCTKSSSKRCAGWPVVGWIALLAAMPSGWAQAQAPAPEREPVTLSVVVVNPSEDKTKTIPVRMDLPQEIAPGDVLDHGELTLEYDDDHKLYYVFKDSVELKPKETRVFKVMLKDKWFVPQGQLDRFTNYTNLLLGRLKNTEFYASAAQLGAEILKKLTDIQTTQNDESLSRKSRIGAYRRHLQVLASVEADLARLEKLLTFTGGPPVPEMLEESPLKSDAPSKTTTWLIIFLIVIFIGLLGGQFFFTWQRRASAQDVQLVRQATFAPVRQGAPRPTPGTGAPGPTAAPRPPSKASP